MATVTIKDVTEYLESFAPSAYQEDYDNSGLLTGNSSDEVKGLLVTLDCTEQVVEEAIASGCNMIVSHHPIIFKGLKKITGQNYVERTIIKAIKNDIAIYAIHTNLDNVHTGVNKKIADKIGLKNTRILDPKKETLTKLTTFTPKKNTDEVLQALQAAGAGNIGNYKNCSFKVLGEGAFLPNELTNPVVGEKGKLEKVEEERIEVIFPSHLSSGIISALKKSHPYEEVAYYLTSLKNENQEVGAGMVGEFESEMEATEFLSHIKNTMQTCCIRFTPLVNQKIKRVVICGGSGSFLLGAAKASGAQAFITADFKYHEFFDAEGKIMIADIGHYESEQFTKDLLVGVLKEKFTTFAINFSKSVTNPISYF